MGITKLLPSSLIRELGPSDLTQICNKLDIDGKWREVAGRITSRVNPSRFIFKMEQIDVIDLRCRGQGSSPTRTFFTSWMTHNPTIADLQEILLELFLYRAADYIHTHVLKETSPPPSETARYERPQEEPVRTCDLPGPSCHQKQQRYDGQQSRYSQHNNLQATNQVHNPAHIYSRDEHDPQPSEHDCAIGDTEVTSSESETISLEEADKMVTEATTVLLTNQASAQRTAPEVERFSYDFLRRAANNFNVNKVRDHGNLLGEGGFGQVFKAQATGYPDMAVKRLNLQLALNEPLALRQFQTELLVLSRCQHDNILDLIGYSDDFCQFCIVYRYMPNGSLEDRLACKDGVRPLTVDQRLSAMKDVAHGIQYLHGLQPPLIHRDIKSANILLDGDFTAKIGDCGTVRLLRLGPQDLTHIITSTTIGTTPYMPLEYIEDGEVSEKLDAYSYGVVVLEVLTGLQAYDKNREDASLATHIREEVEEENDILTMTDQYAGHWESALVLSMYRTATALLMPKRRRKTMTQVLLDIEDWSN